MRLLSVCVVGLILVIGHRQEVPTTPGLLVGPPSPKPQGVSEDVELFRDMVYGTGGGRSLRLHILRPKVLPKRPMPGIVWIHGGAWLRGSRDFGIGMLAPFARKGYLCASIEYRFSTEALFPAQIRDCKAAIRFLRANARMLYLDSEKIGVWGSSAGGHLSALLGTSGGVEEFDGLGGNSTYSSRVQAVCDWFGPTDFLKMEEGGSSMRHRGTGSPESLLLGAAIETIPWKVAQANPISYITREDPPFLIMHGDQDPVVPPSQSHILHRALQKAGIESTLVILPKAGHGGAEFGHPRVRGQIEEFFNRHLKGAPFTAQPFQKSP